MNTHEFLVEIGTEELPPKALKSLSNAFTQGVVDRLQQSGFAFEQVFGYATPRRLAIKISQLASAQPDQQIERRGPAIKAAYDAAGNPTKACQGFARSCGATIDQLDTLETAKGSWLVFRSTQPGKTVSQLIPGFVEASLADLPIPKKMRWGASRTEFVRPVHWVLMLLDDQVINTEILGLPAGNTTWGHRYHHPDSLTIEHPDNYPQVLTSKGYVLADFETRKERIREGIEQQAKTAGGKVVADEELLDEVTSLNEWPVAILGRFEERFLEMPAEALISTMKGHQKYFHLVDKQHNILPYFITVANLESKDPSQVADGNERVIRPRLEDAAFFYETDKKQKLVDRLPGLHAVVFQQQLGSLHDKSMRVSQLAAKIAANMGGNAVLAERAGKLCKADLMTEMVLELPELQGIMGRYYARLDGEAAAVAVALEEQYFPRQAGAELPSSQEGIALSLADKLDTLVGIFGINQPPTGTKDPFALRRAALGVLRIMVEKKLDLDLAECICWAQDGYKDLPAVDTHKAVLDYVLERFRAWYEEKGLPVEVFLSVFARKPSRPLEFHQRVEAVSKFLELEAAQALAAANKRVSNILSKEEGAEAFKLNPELLTEKPEINLHNALEMVSAAILPQLDRREFTAALAQLAELKEPVDAFFDGVMVMVEDEGLRQNRIALLAKLRKTFLQIADISLLQSKT